MHSWQPRVLLKCSVRVTYNMRIAWLMENLFNATITDFCAMLIVAERYVRVRKELSTYAEDFDHHEKGYLISQETAELFAVSLLSVP